MRTLSRYFLASFLNLFVAILLASILIIVVVEMLLHFDEMVSRGEGARGVARYLFLRVPAYYFGYLVPIASFAAAFLCLGLPARWCEITAIKAGGIAPARVSAPVLAAAAALSLLALLVNETLVLQAKRAERLETSPGREITFRRGSFWYHRGDVIYNVREADRETRTLHGVRVFELSPQGRLLRSIRAASVRIDGANWEFDQATFRSFDPSDPTAPPVIEQVERTVLEVAHERDLALLTASAATLSLVDLREYIAARAREGRNTERYRARLHARLAEPVTVFVFALLAVPIGLTVDRSRNVAVAALMGVAALGVFYTVNTIAFIVASEGVATASVGPWMVLALFAGLGTWGLARVPS